MDTILTAVISLSGIGLICAAVITVASKVMFVKVDVRVEKVNKCLPGANCGACGFSSCEAYANALVKGETKPNLCLPGGEMALAQINEILGQESGEGLAKNVAIVQCRGDSTILDDKMNYAGEKTCFSAKQLFGGPKTCTYGCIGYGDCVRVCPSDAICLVDNLARVDPRKCSGCAVCAKICPTGVIAIEKDPLRVAILCKNQEKGAQTKAKCSKGCIGCKKCEKICPAKTIKVESSLASIDYTVCYGCRECVDVCPVNCIL